MPRVLVVDDDPMVCVAIEVCLQRQGFEVTIADGGEAGMQALEASDFDVMLIDVFMPNMRGFESIRTFHDAPARSSDHCDVRLCLRQYRPRARFAADDDRTRRGMLPAQAVHAQRAVDQRQRMPHQIGTVCAPLEKMKIKASMPSQRIILGIGLAILLLIGAASIGLDLKSRADTAAVDHALEVLKKISDIRPLLRRAESAARGFALTGNPDFVKEYNEFSDAILPAFDDLIKTVEGNPGQTQLLEEAKALGGPPDCDGRRVDQAQECGRPGGNRRVAGQCRGPRGDGDDRRKSGKDRRRRAKASRAPAHPIRNQRRLPAGGRPRRACC